MKNIALLTSDLNIEYCLTVLQGITAFFADKNDIHLIITQVKSKNDKHGTYVYQYGSVIDMISAKDIDGYIILSTTFGSFIGELVSAIRKKNNNPILSIGVELFFDNCYSTSCNTHIIYREIVEHLLKKHGCKKIGFFSANESESEEATERYNSYVDALKYYSLELNPDYVLNGNFTKYRSKQVIAEKYKTKDDVPFDAIICANDLTALGCIEAFSEMGISIPNELKVVGFDDASQASLSNPSISTVNQQMYEQGLKAAELIYDLLSGKSISKKTEVPLSSVYRQSCGCIRKSNKDYIYKDKFGKVIRQTTNYREYIKTYYDRISDSRNIYIIFDFIHPNETLESFIDSIGNILNYTKFSGMSISLYEKPINWGAGDNFEFPDKMKLIHLREQTNNISVSRPDEFYNPNEKLLPKELDDIPGLFLLHPVYNCSLNYGYYLCHITEPKLEIYSIYLKIINQAIAQAAEYTRTIERNRKLELEKENLRRTNSDLAKQSKTDELTRILNRRGFMDYGQQVINLSISMDTNGIVFFADLDGLKSINDTYGHEMGDLAIQMAATALKASFRKSDIVGRLSGDEFAVVATEMSIDFLEKTREKLDLFCQKFQDENDVPFILSISLGAVEYTEDSYYLKELLVKADESLYEEKKKHHERLAQLKK